MANLITFLSFPFIQRALLIGCIIGVTAAFLGVHITLRNMSFYADAISHAALAGIALGLFLNISPFFAAVIFCIALGVGIVFIRRRSNVSIDTIIGILFAGGISLGVILISQLHGYRADLFNFLFGDILAVTWDDILLAFVLSILIVSFLLYSSKQLLLGTFSSDFSYVRNVGTTKLEYIFFVVTSLTIALSIKMIGIVLITGLLIIPAAIAKNLAHSFKQTVGLAMIASILSTFIGIILSNYLDIPAGPTIIMVGVFGFIIASLLKTK